MAREHVGRIAQTQNHHDHEFDRRIQDRIVLARDEQDNEFWHLLIMEEFLETNGYKRRWFFDRVLPPWESRYRGDCGHHATVGDMLRQVAWDEEQRKLHSEESIRRGPRS